MKRTLPLLFVLTACVDAPPPTLDLSATKGRTGMTLTNRELEPVTSCDVTLLERGRDDQWYARVPRLEPLQTAQIAWTDFSAHGSPMPPGVGPAALRFTVKCAGDKSVGLTFDR